MASKRSTPLIDNAGAQTGDQSVGNAAGRDVIHGIPASVLDDIREVQMRLIDVLHRGHLDVVDRLERSEDMLRAHELMEQRRRQVDDEERVRRQAALDARLAALGFRVWLVLMIVGLLILGFLVFWFRINTP